MRIGWTEMLLILFLVVLLFGAKRLPELAKALGQSMQEFKKGTRGLLEEEEKKIEEPKKNV